MNALILNNKVVEVSKDTFEVSSDLTWIDCGDDVKRGWSYDGTTFTDTAIISNEQLSAQERNKRDNLLSEVDWTQLPDSQLAETKKAEWATYRQSLRDVPSQASFPTIITWPTKP
tara:strand:- start:1167 stop:1511 length:345 start_codon:yes stop_codon:yes gene_type:complete